MVVDFSILIRYQKYSRDNRPDFRLLEPVPFVALVHEVAKMPVMVRTSTHYTTMDEISFAIARILKEISNQMATDENKRLPRAIRNLTNCEFK